jgi:hypothetical protein
LRQTGAVGIKSICTRLASVGNKLPSADEALAFLEVTGRKNILVELPNEIARVPRCREA